MGVRHHDQNESALPKDEGDLTDEPTRPNNIANSKGDAYVNEESQPLLQVLAGLECPGVRKVKLPNLARTRRERREILEITNLWKSLGRPTSVFWRETRVFYNRIANSYALMSNEQLRHSRRKRAWPAMVMFEFS